MKSTFGSPGEEKMEQSPLSRNRAKSQGGMAKSRKSAGLMRKGMKMKALGHSKAAKR